MPALLLPAPGYTTVQTVPHYLEKAKPSLPCSWSEGDYLSHGTHDLLSYMNNKLLAHEVKNESHFLGL